MSLKILIFSLAAIFISTGNLSAQDKAVNSDLDLSSDQEFYTGEFNYIIGPGDVLEVNVWRHPDLTTEIRVRPDGKISFPLIDEIYAGNLTPTALKKQITEKLSETIQDPRVNVNVISFKSKKIFVLGEVNKPGVYPFEGRVSVLDAVSKAAGYKEETAAVRSVIVIRRGNTPKPEVKRIDLWSIITKANVSQDIYLEASDIVFVPKSFISNLNTFIDKFLTKTDPVLKYYLDIIDIDQRSPAGRLR